MEAPPNLPLPFVINEQLEACAKDPQKLRDLEVFAESLECYVRDQDTGHDFPGVFLDHILHKSLVGRYVHFSAAARMGNVYRFVLGTQVFAFPRNIAVSYSLCTWPSNSF